MKIANVLSRTCKQPASCTACLQIALLQRKDAEAAKAMDQLSEETSAAKAALMHALQASSESVPISACALCSSLFVCCASKLSGFVSRPRPLSLANLSLLYFQALYAEHCLWLLQCYDW